MDKTVQKKSRERTHKRRVRIEGVGLVLMPMVFKAGWKRREWGGGGRNALRGNQKKIEREEEKVLT